MTTAMPAERDFAAAHDRLWSLIKDTRFAMLTHRHSDGELHSHPLTTLTRNAEEGATAYFFVPRDGDIARHVALDSSVNLAYANPGKDSWVSVSGHAMLVDDPARKQALFNTMTKAWFPDGPADPNLALLAVHMLEAEYWDVDDSKMVQLFKMAKAAMTGEQPRDMGEHRKLDLR